MESRGRGQLTSSTTGPNAFICRQRDIFVARLPPDIARRHRQAGLPAAQLRMCPAPACEALRALIITLGSNYGSLLMLDWLVADLPHRLPAAIGILKSVRFEGLLGRQDDIDLT